MSRKRLSKKQLKRDRFVEQTFDWAHWVETHRTQALGTLAVVALLVAGFFIWRQMARSADDTASVAFVQARQAYYAGNWQLAASDLQGFLGRYGGSSYADDARLALAEAYYRSGEYASAAQTLEDFLRRHGDSPLAPNARRLLGATYQQLGQFSQAAATFERALERAENDAMKISYRRALAQIYASQGQIDAAANQYRAIVDLDPDGEQGRRARRDLAEVTVKPIPVTGEQTPSREEGPATAPATGS